MEVTLNGEGTRDDHDLASALRGAHARYIARNPISAAYHRSSLSCFPGGNTRSVIHALPFPLTFERGESHSLYTVDGHAYVDFLSEYSAGLYGHSPLEIRRAISRATEQGWALGGNNVYQTKLAKMVVDRFSMDMVRFTNSGTEANLMAIGAALNFTGRSKAGVMPLQLSSATESTQILIFVNGYHGSVFSFPTDGPNKYSMNAKYDFVLAPYNDIPGTEREILRLPIDSLAAVLVEPMQGAGGCIPAEEEFLHYLQEMAKRLGALFILDEVMTSRCAWGGLQNKLSLHPDLCTLGKWIGGGLNFGAFGGRREIMELFDPHNSKCVHSGTFNNNVVTMAAGVAGLELLTKATLDRLTYLGDNLSEQILHAIQTIPRGGGDDGKALNVTATGVGSVLSVTFHGREKDILQGLFYHHMLENGIYLATRGYVALNIEIKEEHIAKFLDALKGFLVKYKDALTVGA